VHYKTGGVEPIDLYKSVKPHPSLNAFEVKALTDNIKYSFRMLSRGISNSDAEKVLHYTQLMIASYNERPIEKILSYTTKATVMVTDNLVDTMFPERIDINGKVEP
jgi:hypothetical protein